MTSKTSASERSASERERALSELVNVNWAEPKTKSHLNCCVPQCNSRVRLGEISLHSFPTVDKTEHKEWVTKLRIGKDISKWMKVCSKHFNDDDFHSTWLKDQRRILKKGAVPSMNLPVRSTDQLLSPEQEEMKLARTIRKQKRSRSLAQLSPNKIGSDVSKENDVTSTPVPKKSGPWRNLWDLETPELNALSDTDPDIIEVNLSAPSPVPSQDGNHTITPEEFEPSRPASVEIGIQCDSVTADKNIQVNASHDLLKDINGIKFCLSDILVNDKKLNVFTGIASLATLDIIEEEVIVAGACPMLHMTVRDMIILVLIRLKLNIPFIALSTLFSLSDSAPSRVFRYCLPFLSYVLRSLIVWPDKEEIMKNIPKCFAKFSKVRVVLDCTEIHCEKSKCLQCRLKTYSNYKGAHTVKFLIGVSPAGLITSVSKPFGGRASDKAIFQRSDLPEKLESYVDEVMVDKGFNIEDECANIGVNLVRPPFLRKAKQFSKGDSIRTAEIARARVHVERAIQRIKVFGILSSRLNWEMLNYIDHIMFIVCGIVNLGPPILSNDKF